MNAQQLLDNFVAQHPDYWNFNNELQEVERLKKKCETENNEKKFIHVHHDFRNCLKGQ